MGRHTSSHSASPPTKGRGSSPHGRKRSPVPSSRRDREREKDREKSPSTRRHRSSHARKAETSPARGRSISPPPPREKKHLSSRGSAKLVRDNSRSPASRSRSPSPRAKRLKRAQVDRERERVNERDHGIQRGSDRERDRGRSDRDMGSERKDKRGYKRDEDTDNLDDNGRSRSSRSRHERGPSSPECHRNGRSRHRSQSPQNQAAALDEVTNSRGGADRNDENDSIARMKAAEEALEAKQKQKPSFELSGNLAAETNRVRGVTLLYNEPPEACKPDIKWRLYVFKAGEVLNEPLYIHRQSSYLFGRERRVADIPTDHPSCSKQHAVIQFRQVEKEQPDGLLSKQIRPYLMDLGSTNKTYINDSPIEPQRYYELRERDTIKFGNSSREYVLLHENSAG